MQEGDTPGGEAEKAGMKGSDESGGEERDLLAQLLDQGVDAVHPHHRARHRVLPHPLCPRLFAAHTTLPMSHLPGFFRTAAIHAECCGCARQEGWQEEWQE